MSKFPKTINVVYNDEGDNSFLSVIDVEKDNLHEYDGQTVVTYEKVSTGVVRITQEIVG